MTTVPLSQADLLALLKRTSDPTWLSGMLSTPDGQAIMAAWCAVWERASIAISKQVDASMISTAPAGSPGVCTLILSRADTSAAGIIPQGYTFVSKLGVQLVVAMDVTVSTGQATVALPLVTLRQTDLVNTSDPAFDDLLDVGDYVDAILGSANPAVPDSGPPQWILTGMLNPAGPNAAVLLPDGRVVFGGGYGPSGGLVMTYDPTTQITAVTGNMARYFGYTATLLPPSTGHPLGLILFTGGTDSSFNVIKTAELYDPVTGTTTAVGDMTWWRNGHSATLLPSGEVLIAGGDDGGSFLASAELFTPSTKTFTAVGSSLSEAKERFSATLLSDGRILFAGGQGLSSATSSADIYSGGIFTPTTPMLSNRAGHTATLLQDGNILLTGGDDGYVSLATAELYNVSSATFVATGSLSTAREGHAAIGLPDGTVLVTGGVDNPGGVLATTELYSGGTFAASPDLSAPRVGHYAVLLPGAIVLVAGGNTTGGGALPTIEEYRRGLLFGRPHSPHSLTYVSSTPIVGAIEDWLSAHGDERGCKRQDGEDAENYRARVRAIPDAVSPNAVARALDGCSALLPERWLVEPFLDGADPAARLALQLGFADSPSCDGSFCDDWLGEPLAAKQPLATCECVGLRESRAYVRVDLVGELQDPDGMVLSCDDEGYCDDENWGYPDIGDHPAISSALQALLQELRSKIAGGVQTDVYLDDLEYLQASQEIVMGSPGIAMILDLTPPAGQFWLLKEGLLTAFPLNPADLSTQTIALGLMFADSSTLLTPWMPGDFPLRTFELEKIGYHGQQVVEIVALLQSSVPADVYCAGNFAVISGTL